MEILKVKDFLQITNIEIENWIVKTVVFYKVCLLNKPKVDIKESEIKSFEMV